MHTLDWIQPAKVTGWFTLDEYNLFLDCYQSPQMEVLCMPIRGRIVDLVILAGPTTDGSIRLEVSVIP